MEFSSEVWSPGQINDNDISVLEDVQVKATKLIGYYIGEIKELDLWRLEKKNPERTMTRSQKESLNIIKERSRIDTRGNRAYRRTHTQVNSQ